MKVVFIKKKKQKQCLRAEVTIDGFHLCPPEMQCASNCLRDCFFLGEPCLSSHLFFLINSRTSLKHTGTHTFPEGQQISLSRPVFFDVSSDRHRFPRLMRKSAILRKRQRPVHTFAFARDRAFVISYDEGTLGECTAMPVPLTR